MLDHLLPIGSVVMLKNAMKKLMIIGILQKDRENPDKDYDYIGVLYPEGYLTKNAMFLFNHDDIVDIEFTGYNNEERAAFVSKVQEYLSEQPNQN